MLNLSTKLPDEVTILGKVYKFYLETGQYEFNHMDIVDTDFWQDIYNKIIK